MSLVACAGTSGSEGESSESDLISHVQSITRRPDGLFDVVCNNGRREVATEDEVLANTICARPAPWRPDGGGAQADASPWPVPDAGNPWPRPDAGNPWPRPDAGNPWPTPDAGW